MQNKSLAIFVILSFSFLFLLLLFFHKPDAPLTIVYSTTSQYENGYTQNLAVIDSSAASFDFHTCANNIIEHCLKNSFPNHQFSYDLLGYPSQLHVTVYTNKDNYEHNDSLFSFTYRCSKKYSDSYDIYHNSDQFSIFIDPPCKTND